MISGKVRDTIWQEAWVALDMEDRITDYNCGCSNSKSFKGMCRHCAALTLKYRQLCLKPGWNKQANGEDAEGTPEQNVKTGVLLKNLLNRFDSTKIVAVTAEGSVHLYPKVESDGGKYHLALSIGNDRKKYTVNNIYHFLYMTETRAFERYGRHLSFTHDRSAFSENALSLIDFMMAYLKTVKDGFKTEDLLSFPASSVLSLNNYGMDELLVLYLGSSLELNNCIYEIVEKPPILDVLFEPVEGGVEISIGMVKVFDGARHGYIFMDRKIYQCPED